MKESALERKVVAYCRKNALLCYKFVSPGNRGVPDRLIVAKGKVLFLELKKKGKKPSPLQEHEMMLLRGQGVSATDADSFSEARWIIDRIFGLETEV